MDTSGMSWVIGGLLAVLAIALVIAGATGHAQQLFAGVTGKSTKASTASSPGAPPANLTADAAVAASLSALGTTAPSGSSSATTPTVNPYAGLSQISGTTV